jgi:hypothetical protein
MAEQLALFSRPTTGLLTWRNLCGIEPAYWEWMDMVEYPSGRCGGGYMPRDEEGYALIDSRDLNPPRLHSTPWGKRWDK